MGAPPWLGVPCVSLRAHGCPWGPMGAPQGWGSPGCPYGWRSHGFFRGPLGVHGVPWVLLMIGGPWVSMESYGCPPMVGGPLGVPKGP